MKDIVAYEDEYRETKEQLERANGDQRVKQWRRNWNPVTFVSSATGTRRNRKDDSRRLSPVKYGNREFREITRGNYKYIYGRQRHRYINALLYRTAPRR
eukprot:jgi/Galph1/3487/GphlegSOOS_G2182.1